MALRAFLHKTRYDDLLGKINLSEKQTQALQMSLPEEMRYSDKVVLFLKNNPEKYITEKIVREFYEDLVTPDYIHWYLMNCCNIFLHRIYQPIR